MKGTYIKYAGMFYVIFALCTAHIALAPSKAPVAVNAYQGRVVDETPRLVRDHQRLDNSGEKAEVNKADYVIEVWSAGWCRPCQIYKRLEVPALLKAGYTVVIKDFDKDDPPESITKVPTIRLFYKQHMLQQKIYWRAKDINKYVDTHLSLKG